MKKENNNGRSMVEMLGVLAIVGVLSATALKGYSKLMAQHKINKTINQMVQIVNNIHVAFASGGEATPYANLNNEMALKLNVFPQEMVVNSNNPFTGIVHLYKGIVRVEAVNGGKSFAVIFEDLPKDVSLVMSTTDWGVEDKSIGLQEISLNGD